MKNKNEGDGQEQKVENRPEQKLMAPDAIQALNAGGAQMQSMMKKHTNNWASAERLFAIEDSGQIIARQKPATADNRKEENDEDARKIKPSLTERESDTAEMYDTDNVGLAALSNPQLGTYSQALELTSDPVLRQELKRQATELDRQAEPVLGASSLMYTPAADHAGTFNVNAIQQAQSEKGLISSEQFLAEHEVQSSRAKVADENPEFMPLLAQLGEQARGAEKPLLKGYIAEPESSWQAFQNLTTEQRAEVIRIMNNASRETIDSLKQQGRDVLHAKPVIDFVLSIDRSVRSLGTGLFKENIFRICQDLQKIATGQTVGRQEPIEKTSMLGAGTLMKGIQGVDQVGQHLHPRAFVHDTHATADAMRQGIDSAAHYYGDKFENNDLRSIPGETIDGARYAKERASAAINEFPHKDVSEQSNLLGMGATAAVFFLLGKRILSCQEAAKVLGVEERTLTTATKEQLVAKGLTKISKDKIPNTREGYPLQFSNDSGIEMFESAGQTSESIWKKGWSVRGFEGEGEMGSSGMLARNFPTVDDAVFMEGEFQSMKTIDLNAPTYQSLEKLEKRLNAYLDKIDGWEGQKKLWGGRRIDPDEIEQKVLHIGIPNSSITQEQVKVFEQFGKNARNLGIKIKVTVIE